MAVIGTYTKEGNVRIVLSVGKVTTIPADNSNADYREILKKLALGDTIDPYFEPIIDLDAQDVAEIEAMLLAPGSVLRALITIVFKEINKLRILNGDPAYTLAQFKSALKSEMR